MEMSPCFCSIALALLCFTVSQAEISIPLQILHVYQIDFAGQITTYLDFAGQIIMHLRSCLNPLSFIFVTQI